MRKPICLATAALLLCAGVLSAGDEEPLRLEPLVREALERNPKILAARGRHSALNEKVPQSGALDDPMVSFGVVNLPTSFDFSEEDMTAKEFAVSQKFPFPGKLALSEEVSRREADAGGAEAEETANQVIREVKAAYYDLSHVYRAMEVTRRSQAILEELAHITQTRYALGRGIQEDVVRIQVEISKMLDELIMLEQKKKALAAKLNALLSRPRGNPVGKPVDLDFHRLEFTIDALQQRALDENPMLRALKQDVEGRRKSVDLAKKDYLPDFGLKFAYGQRESRPDMLTGMIELNLPIFVKSKQERRVAEAYADVRSAQARRDSAENEILYMIADMGSMAQRLERRVALYRTGILPQARMQIDAAMSAYMVDKADFMTLLDSRMRLYRYELEFHDALTEYEKSLAALEAAVGAPLSREVAK
jgi:outer membrane protein TolC